jgi:hypothetical protein
MKVNFSSSQFTYHDYNFTNNTGVQKNYHGSFLTHNIQFFAKSIVKVEPRNIWCHVIRDIWSISLQLQYLKCIMPFQKFHNKVRNI